MDDHKPLRVFLVSQTIVCLLVLWLFGRDQYDSNGTSYHPGLMACYVVPLAIVLAAALTLIVSLVIKRVETVQRRRYLPLGFIQYENPYPVPWRSMCIVAGLLISSGSSLISMLGFLGRGFTDPQQAGGAPATWADGPALITIAMTYLFALPIIFKRLLQLPEMRWLTVLHTFFSLCAGSVFCTVGVTFLAFILSSSYHGMLWAVPAAALACYTMRPKRALPACASCGQRVRPYAGPRGGAWSGTADQLASLPKIEPDNAFLCEQCGAMICPICAGRKASELGVRTFVCTKCGHTPVKTIFRI